MDIQRINAYRKELMGFAGLWIFCLHVWEPLFGNSDILFLKNVEWYIKTVGYCGVEIFLFLSGMGLVYAICKQNLKTFYIRRFLRVYPAFFLWFTISTLIRSDKMSLSDYIGRLCFYSNWAEDLLAYKWYIPAIFMFYLWFPLYYKILKKQKKPIFFTFALIGIESSVIVLFYHNIREDLFLFLNRIPIFILGVLCGHLCKEMSDDSTAEYCMKKKGWILTGVIGVIFLAVSFYFHAEKGLSSLGQSLKNIVNMFLAVLICFGCAKGFGALEKNRYMNIVRDCLSFLGIYSLEFYLTHELISLKIKSYHLQLTMFKVVDKLVTIMLCFGISLLAAWVLKKIVDIGMKCFLKQLVEGSSAVSQNENKVSSKN